MLVSAVCKLFINANAWIIKCGRLSVNLYFAGSNTTMYKNQEVFSANTEQAAIDCQLYDYIVYSW